MYRVSIIPVLATRHLRLKNLVASVAVTALACAIYGFTPNGQKQLDHLYGFAGFSIIGNDFLVTATLWYMALLPVYYLAERNPRSSKSLLFFRVVGRFVRSPSTEWTKGLSREDRVAVLVTLLKAFFAPMMVMSLLSFFMGAVTPGA